MKKIKVFIKNFMSLYNENRLAVCAAALSYQVTLSFFPLLICLYTLLGNSYEKLMRIIELADGVLAEDTVQLISEFAEYVAKNNSQAMMMGGIILLISTASGTIRTLSGTIGNMQGGNRFRGLWDYLVSFVLSIVLLIAVYFAVIVMFTGKDFIDAVNKYIPFFDISSSWRYLRYILLAGIFFVLICCIFASCRRKTDMYGIVTGSLITTAALVAASYVFAIFIRKLDNNCSSCCGKLCFCDFYFKIRAVFSRVRLFGFFDTFNAVAILLLPCFLLRRGNKYCDKEHTQRAFRACN